MNDKELMLALLAGKKMKTKNGDDYIFINEEGNIENNKYKFLKKYFFPANDYEEYVEYVDFNTAMQHIANGGRAKRKGWKWSIYIDPDSVLEKIRVYDNHYATYEVTKNDILTKDWILL